MTGTSERVVLLFNADNAQQKAVSTLAPLLGARVKVVEKEEYALTIESLCRGETGKNAPAPARTFSEIMMVMAGFPREVMSLFLEGLKRGGGTGIRLKAVLTPTNAGWSAVELRDELMREEENLRAKKPE